MISTVLKRFFALFLSIALIHSESVLIPMWVLAADDDAPSLENVEVAENQVTLQTTGSVKYKAFLTATPPRLVIDMFDTSLHVTSRSKAGRGSLLKSVRLGQYKGGPNPTARAVMDLTQTTAYKIDASDDSLVIRLVPTKLASASKAPTSNFKAPAQLVEKTAAAPIPPAPTDSPKMEIEAAPQKTASGGAKSNDDGFSEESMKTTTSGDLNTFSTQASVAPEEKELQDAPAQKLPLPGPIGVGKHARRDIMSSLPKDLVSFDYDNADIHDILRWVATKTRLNVVAGSDVSGSLTLHLTDVPFDEAFGMILSIKGLVVTQVGDNVLRVMSPATLEKERAATVGTTRIYQLNYSNAVDAKGEIDQVRTAEKRIGNTTIDQKNNALIITDTPEGHSAIEHLLSQIDVKPHQVLIEAKLVEVKLSKELDLGIQWDYYEADAAGNFLGKQGVNVIGANPVPTPSPGQQFVTQPYNQQVLSNFPNATGATGATGRGTGVNLVASNIFGALTLGRVTNNYFLSATLSAAASQGKIKVLSDPKIATLNGKLATINITTQIPYVTSSVTSTGVATQAVNYTTTGIQLAVTPTINADRRITLKVTPNVSQPSSIAAAAGVTGAVSVDSRQADTTVLVRDGETIVIGGLITDSLSDVTASVPFFGDIPILGWLFKKKTKIRSRVELLIFVTTKILD